MQPRAWNSTQQHDKNSSSKLHSFVKGVISLVRAFSEFLGRIRTADVVWWAAPEN